MRWISALAQQSARVLNCHFSENWRSTAPAWFGLVAIARALLMNCWIEMVSKPFSMIAVMPLDACPVPLYIRDLQYLVFYYLAI
eukprot:SAG22_NODE_5882_length_936_cov_1.954600_1_plen_84_part_00